jgi:hypothetical protein
MSDYSDGSGSVSRRPRVSDNPAPVSGVVAIVLAVVAVVAGYLILDSITEGGTDGGLVVNEQPGDGATDGATDGSVVTTIGSTDTLAPTTTQPAFTTTGASVIVANANGTSGSAGKASRVLTSSAGFTLVEPTDAASTVQALDTSLIYFDSANPSAQPVAEALNAVLGGALNVAPMPPTGAPVADGDLKGAGVLLMLGLDFADMTPGQLNLAAIGGAAPAATNPAVATTAPAG